MTQVNGVGVVRHLRAFAAWAGLALILALYGVIPAAQAQESPSIPPPSTLEEKVDALQKLLADPELRAALTRSEPAAPRAGALMGGERKMMDSALDRWVARVEAHVWAVIGAARDLPSDLAAALARAGHVIGQAGWLGFLLSVAATLAGAFAVEAICRRVVAGRATHAETQPEPLAVDPAPLVPQAPDDAAPAIIPADEGIPLASTLAPAPVELPPTASPDPWPVERILAGILPLGAFILTLVILHILLRGPEPLGPLVQPWLIALILMRVTAALTRFSFMLPDASPVPGAREFWVGRLVLMAAILGGGWALSHSVGVLGGPMDCVILLRYLTGLVLLVVAAVTIWRNPEVEADPAPGRRRRLFVTVWLALIATLEIMGALIPFWLAVYAIGLPPLLRQVTRIVHGLLPRTGGPTRGRTLLLVLADRGGRALVMIAAALWLAWLVRNDGASRYMHEATVDMLITGALRGVVILLLADLCWHVLSALISDSIRRAAMEQDAASLAKTARMRTLLPIFRAVAGAAILVIAVMMVLAGMGVEIAPLIAGAGIFGVAIGFGSQTLVKDVISGIFYMIDDAFRVGEYIQSGSYRGVVEGFSLRSVRLRHHRGPVFTVPFGTLGAVQNMSRDWSKDKFLINVPFDTDVEQVRKLIKKVGQTLQEDPEVGPLFIQPIKMKGVEQFTDYGMTLGVAMILHPTPMLSPIRRRAYKMILDAFRENGIELASPTVQVAGHGGDDDNDAERAAALAAERRRRAAEAASAAGT